MRVTDSQFLFIFVSEKAYFCMAVLIKVGYMENTIVMMGLPWKTYCCKRIGGKRNIYILEKDMLNCYQTVKYIEMK